LIEEEEEGFAFASLFALPTYYSLYRSSSFGSLFKSDSRYQRRQANSTLRCALTSLVGGLMQIITLLLLLLFSSPLAAIKNKKNKQAKQNTTQRWQFVSTQ
jgi:hypothetical protein